MNRMFKVVLSLEWLMTLLFFSGLVVNYDVEKTGSIWPVLFICLLLGVSIVSYLYKFRVLNLIVQIAYAIIYGLIGITLVRDDLTHSTFTMYIIPLLLIVIPLLGISVTFISLKERYALKVHIVN